MSELNSRHLAFCYEYIANNFNGTRAAIAAGYSEDTAPQESTRLLNNVNVKAKIDELTTKYMEKCSIRAEDVLREIAIIANADITDYVEVGQKTVTFKDLEAMGDARRAIQSIEVIESTSGAPGRIKFRLHSKEKCLELLAKHKQLLTDKLDLTSGGKKIETPIIYLPGNSRDRDAEGA